MPRWYGRLIVLMVRVAAPVRTTSARLQPQEDAPRFPAKLALSSALLGPAATSGAHQHAKAQLESALTPTNVTAFYLLYNL
jgi:hypothetical protein